MSDWHYSIVLICQAADQANSNIIAELLEYGPDTFSLPAGPEGATEPTHYFNHSFGAQLAWADALEFRRYSPTVLAISAGLGMSEEQLDELFRTAATIEA